jgi:hypothetical protein
MFEFCFQLLRLAICIVIGLFIWQSDQSLFINVVVLLLVLCILIPALSALKTLLVYKNYFNFNNINEPKKIVAGDFICNIACKFALAAHFAAVVYRDDKPEKERALCDLEPGNPYGMPSDEQGEWIRWEGNGSTDVKPAFADKSGLYYETYVYLKQNRDIEFAMICFRGTENHKGQFRKDWGTNIAASIGKVPKQYVVAFEKMQHLIPALKKENPNIKIYSVGHSLGGGLAQSVGYMSKDIDAVFTFNSSPVTNWGWLAQKGLIQNRFPTIFRLTNGGEILWHLRNVATTFSSTRFNRHDIDIQLTEKHLFEAHSMPFMAGGLVFILMGCYENMKRGVDGSVNPATMKIDGLPQMTKQYIELNLIDNKDGYSYCDDEIKKWFREIVLVKDFCLNI